MTCNLKFDNLTPSVTNLFIKSFDIVILSNSMYKLFIIVLTFQVLWAFILIFQELYPIYQRDLVLRTKRVLHLGHSQHVDAKLCW